MGVSRVGFIYCSPFFCFFSLSEFGCGAYEFIFSEASRGSMIETTKYKLVMILLGRFIVPGRGRAITADQ